jgi:hypothetical protein
MGWPSVPVALLTSLPGLPGRSDGRELAACSISTALGRVYLPVNSSVECRIVFWTTRGVTPARSSKVAHWHRNA